MDARANLGDWRDGDAYAPLLLAERAVFAWEWLRRNPAYRTAAELGLRNSVTDERVERKCQPEAATWGLHAFENPALAAPLARPVWRADSFSLVLSARAGGLGKPADHFDIAQISRSATLVTGERGGDHLLISNGLRTIRLDVTNGGLRNGPVRLAYQLAGFESAEAPLLVLRRLVSFWRDRRFSPALHPREARARRWVLTLRVADAVADGAQQREIAAKLLDPEATEPCWRSRMPSVRSQVQRLVQSAGEMTGNGFLRFLT